MKLSLLSEVFGCLFTFRRGATSAGSRIYAVASEQSQTERRMAAESPSISATRNKTSIYFVILFYTIFIHYSESVEGN